MPSDMYPCPCCGYFTIAEPTPGSFQLCDICAWDDRPETLLTELRRAQMRFIATGASDDAVREFVRSPQSTDVRLPDWQPLDELDEPARLATLAAVDKAFGAMERGSGMTIYDAELADGYGMECSRAVRIRGLSYQRWTDIAADVLAEFAVLAFFDPESFRFHIPAYITWSLNHVLTSDSISSDFTIYALDPGGPNDELRDWHIARYAGFTAEQSAAIAQFLHYVLTFARDHFDDRIAQLAWSRWWRHHAPQPGQDYRRLGSFGCTARHEGS